MEAVCWPESTSESSINVGQPCGDWESRLDATNAECCNEPGEDCSGGIPLVCNADCAQILVPFAQDCLTETSSGAGSASAEALTQAAAECPSVTGSTTKVNLPDTCPSVECADVFTEFFDDCHQFFAQHPDDVTQAVAAAFNTDCQELVAATASSNGCVCSVCAGAMQTTAATVRA